MLTYLFWDKKNKCVLNHSGFSATFKNSWLRPGYFWFGKKLLSSRFPTYTDLKPFWQLPAWWLDAVSKRNLKILKRRQESLCSSQFAFFIRLFFSRLSLASSSISGKTEVSSGFFCCLHVKASIPPHVLPFLSYQTSEHVKICFYSFSLSITYCLISASGNIATKLNSGIWTWGDEAGRMEWLFGVTDTTRRG